MCGITSVNIEKTLEYLKTKIAYGLKIFPSIIYVKEYFHVFLYSERYYTSKN